MAISRVRQNVSAWQIDPSLVTTLGLPPRDRIGHHSRCPSSRKQRTFSSNAADFRV